MVEDFETNAYKMLQKQVRNRYEAHKEVDDLQKKLGKIDSLKLLSVS